MTCRILLMPLRSSGIDEGELRCLGRQLRGVSPSSRPSSHGRTLDPGHDETAREDLVADRLVDGVGPTGKQGFVDVERRDSTVSPSTTIWSPGPSSMMPSEDDFLRRHLDRDAVAAHRRLGLSDDGELVERLFGAIPDDADTAVGDDDQPEEAVLERPGHHQREEDAEHGVDAREHVGADDLAHGPPVFSPATFTCPAETRWATCAAVSPARGSTGSVRPGFDGHVDSFHQSGATVAVPVRRVTSNLPPGWG